jgi:hypothetical protein
MFYKEAISPNFCFSVSSWLVYMPVKDSTTQARDNFCAQPPQNLFPFEYQLQYRFSVVLFAADAMRGPRVAELAPQADDESKP